MRIKPAFVFVRAPLLGLLLGAVAFGASPRWTVARLSAPGLVRGFAAEPLASDGLRQGELAFLEKAAEISRQRVQLARLALSQANAAEVRAFAQQLAGDYQQIGDSVDALRRRKAALPDAAPGESKDKDIVVSESQQKLAQKSGAEFDRDFLRFMAEQHADALALFEQATAHAKDPDVRELAGSFLPTLREHHNRIVDLRKMLE